MDALTLRVLLLDGSIEEAKESSKFWQRVNGKH